MEQFLIDAMPYFAGAAVAFNSFCLASVIYYSRQTDKHIARAKKALDELEALRH